MTQMSSLLEPSKINQMIKIIQTPLNPHIQFQFPWFHSRSPPEACRGWAVCSSATRRWRRWAEARRAAWATSCRERQLDGDPWGPVMGDGVQRWLGGWSDSDLVSIFTASHATMHMKNMKKWLLNLKLELLTDWQKEHSSKSSWTMFYPWPTLGMKSPRTPTDTDPWCWGARMNSIPCARWRRAADTCRKFSMV